MRIICLDAEFADNEELLELSVFSTDGDEIYHRFYSPERVDTWRTDIHHITPEMVAGLPPFAKVREEVQEIIDSADAVTGFAVDNDFRVLERSGITGLWEKKVLDVKEMYWLLRGRQAGRSPYNVPSLLICANELGLNFQSGDAHSASNDTKATLECFNTLFNEYRADAGLEEDSQIFDSFRAAVDSAMEEFVEESARGFVKLCKNGSLYKLRFGRTEDADKSQVIFEVPVADRFKAEYELRKMLRKKEVPDKIHLYKLTPELIEDIKRYRNEYDAEESAWCKKVIKNLSRLSL